MGNTGNARTTPPHLHFGLRVGGRAVDPAPYLASPGELPEVTSDVALLGVDARVDAGRVRLRAGPSTSHPIRAELPRSTALRCEAAGGGWYRVRLGDGRRGYVASRLVEEAAAPLRRLAVAADAYLHDRPAELSPQVHRVAGGEELAVLAQLGDFLLVRAASGAVGWLQQPVTASRAGP